MFTAWRRAASAVIVGAAVIAAPLTVVSQAEAAGPTITIGATSPIPAVTRDVFVAYRGGVYGSAKIHGTITGAKGDIATLYARRFPYRGAAAPVGSIRLRSAKARYSFTVTPTLATRYTVRLFTRRRGASALAVSAVRYVYVVPDGYSTGGQNCRRPVCRETYHFYTYLPSSALRTEMRKHAYSYFALILGSRKIPSAPKWLHLNAGHPVFSKLHRLSATEFEVTLSYWFIIRQHSYDFNFVWCTQDTVSRDGIGLPGRHGCGARVIRGNASYLG